MGELELTSTEIIKYVQHSHCLADSVRKLDPVMDEAGMLRVGGRLKHSKLPVDVKHPIILPRDSQVSRLILTSAHQKVGHLGTNSTLTELRRKYWIPRASQLVRSIIAKCVLCQRYRGRLQVQKMANLPEERLEPGQPAFTKSGVDYFGPLGIKRGRSVLKRYGVIFTCMASRAVHLEVAQDLSADSCINAVRRFAARRTVKFLRSDNGTNLVGAEREMREEMEKWNQAKIDSSLKQIGIQWEFNCPLASHHGGAWERLIRSTRKVLYGVMKEQPIRLDNEGLCTLFCEVEAILNSRPITKTSSDSEDEPVLTPNHLLRMDSDQRLPPGIFVKEDLYLKKRWRQVQYLTNVFWRRWSREYLVRLLERQKWHKETRNIKVGDVVLVADNNLVRNRWPMGRVTEATPSEDGLVRSVTVHTGSSELKRPITKLCLLLEAD